MKIEERKVYRCEFCKYHSLSPSSTSRHEKYCRKNHHNEHKCFQYCKHLFMQTDYVGSDEESAGIRTVSFICLKKGIPLYSYKAEKKGIVDKYCKGQDRMPLECDKYEYNPEGFEEENNNVF